MMAFVLAHLSDPHLGPLPSALLSELAGKRLLGFLNWHRRRARMHRPETVAAIVHDLKAQAPDHIAVTGDLVNIALPGEFPQARRWIEGLGSPHDVTVVPGNHDAYVRAAADDPSLSWGEYMCGDDDAATLAFPFVRRRGPLALVGLSTAVPTAPFMATGRLGSDQIGKLADILDQLGKERLFRAVLIHHPPVSTHRRHKRLVDAAAFLPVLARHGAELVLHGHDHVRALVWIDGPGGRIPAVGVPSASMAVAGHDDLAAYNLYTIDGSPGAWRCEAVTRGLGPDGVTVGELEHRSLVGS